MLNGKCAISVVDVLELCVETQLLDRTFYLPCKFLLACARYDLGCLELNKQLNEALSLLRHFLILTNSRLNQKAWREKRRVSQLLEQL